MSQEVSFNATFGKRLELKSPVGVNSQVLCHTIPKRISGPFARMSNHSQGGKTVSSLKLVKANERKIGKTRVRTLSAIVRSDKQRARPVTKPEMVK